MKHRWHAIRYNLVRCERCGITLSVGRARRGGFPCVPEKDPITISGPVEELQAAVRALDRPKAVVASSQPVGTLFRCLDCPGVVTFDSEELAEDHRETTLVDTGEAHRVEAMLEIHDEKGNE